MPVGDEREHRVGEDRCADGGAVMFYVICYQGGQGDAAVEDVEVFEGVDGIDLNGLYEIWRIGQRNNKNFDSRLFSSDIQKSHSLKPVSAAFVTI